MRCARQSLVGNMAPVLFLLLSATMGVQAFTTTFLPRTAQWCGQSLTLATKASIGSTTDDNTQAVATLESQIDAVLAAGQDPIPLLEQLEALEDPTAQPNRSPQFLGQWHVWWTNCPPPSNGQLGPFQGTSEQVIQDTTSASYQNVLRVPPNDWLMAVLDGVYQDWNGQYLHDKDDNNDDDNGSARSAATTTDWGARHWKVTFVRLVISVFGFPIVQKEFPPDTSRVWRTTFMRDNVRVVRAGKTGRLDDEVVFYTKRQPKP